MSRDHATALIEAVHSDPDLQARFTAASGWDEAAAIAAELGFEISPDDIAEVLNDGELDDSELETVAGGIGVDPSDFDDAPTWSDMNPTKW